MTTWTHGGRPLRLLCLIDEYTREALAIRVERSIGAGGTPGFGTPLGPGNRVAIEGSFTDLAGRTGQDVPAVAAVTAAGSNNVNLPATGISGFNAGTVAISLFNRGLTNFINLELSALEADGRGKIISSPRVLTADNVEAVIEQGTEIPFQQATSSGATSVSFRKAVLALKVKPQITPDGNVVMELDVNKDSIGQILASGASIDTKHVKTNVLFGDLPVVGNLFRNTARRDNKTELLIFITPRLVQDRSAQR
ncbi:MAG: hypothetical protein FJY55_03335 [Betaproteobacteria bacterium]|nr:hypothetical protein [Betaproteobacteria bacterium]